MIKAWILIIPIAGCMSVGDEGKVCENQYTIQYEKTGSSSLSYYTYPFSGGTSKIWNNLSAQMTFAEKPCNPVVASPKNIALPQLEVQEPSGPYQGFIRVTPNAASMGTTLQCSFSTYPAFTCPDDSTRGAGVVDFEATRQYENLDRRGTYFGDTAIIITFTGRAKYSFP